MLENLRKIRKKLIEKQLKKSMFFSVSESSVLDVSRVRVSRYSGCKLTIGNKSMVSGSLVYEKDNANIVIGHNTFIGGCTVSCAYNVEIGHNVQIAWGGIIFDHSSHSLDYLERRRDLPQTFDGKKTWDNVFISSTRIEDDVWIGANSIILAGVALGRGVVVGAGSVVTRSFPEMVFVAGNPARIVRSLSD